MKEIEIVTITKEELEKMISNTVKEAFSLQQNNSKTDLKIKENFATREEVGVALKISLPTVDKRTKKGILKGYRMEGSVRYKWSEVDAALKLIQTGKI